jgi:hypothetical protein
MAQSNEKTKYYLTDNGWVAVYTKTDFSDGEKQLVDPIPSPFYKICEYSEYQDTPDSKIEKAIRCTYTNPNSAAKQIIIRYGDCPQVIEPA